MYTNLAGYLKDRGGRATMNELLAAVNADRRHDYRRMMNRFTPTELSDICPDAYDLREVGTVDILDAAGRKDSGATYNEDWSTWGDFTLVYTEEAYAQDAERERRDRERDLAWEARQLAEAK